MTDPAASDEAELQRERRARADAEAERAKAEGVVRDREAMLRALCHALRTPLAVISMRSDMLLAKPDDPVARERALRIIRAGAMTQAAIIDNAVEWSRMLEGKAELDLTSVDLAGCVRDVLKRVATVAGEKNVELSSREDPGSWSVRGDPARLKLAIFNLVGNAVKFTPTGGRVDASLERGRTTASVRVSDTGAGFSPEDGARLFEPGTWGEPEGGRGGGLGLGLAVAGWIARIHGGTIAGSSAGVARGASFVLTLPADAEPAGGEPAGGGPGGGPGEGRPTSHS